MVARLIAGVLLLLPAQAMAQRGPEPSRAAAIDAAAYGAVCDGAKDVGPAVNAAIAAASARPEGAMVELPSGRCRLDLSAGAIVVRGRVGIAGQGAGRTILIVDDTAGASMPAGITNQAKPGEAGAVAAPGGGVFFPLAGFTLRALTLLGTADTLHTKDGPHLVGLRRAQDVRVQDCEFLAARMFSLYIADSDRVWVRDNRVERSTADSIATSGSRHVKITGNYIRFSGDDSISLGSPDAYPDPAQDILVDGNTIEDGQGIQALGVKATTISNNIIRRAAPYGIQVGAAPNFVGGDSAVFGLRITGNQIFDVMDYASFPPGAGAGQQSYIILGSAQRQPGPHQDAAPGLPASGSGAVTSLYGSDTGQNFYAPRQTALTPHGVQAPAWQTDTFYPAGTIVIRDGQGYLAITGGRSGSGPAPGPAGQDIADGALRWRPVGKATTILPAPLASPGGWWVVVEGNTLARTLGPVARWSQWGTGPGRVLGRVSGPQVYDGPIREESLRSRGILVQGGLRNTVIRNNVIQTSGPVAIDFDPLGATDRDYTGLLIAGNDIADFSRAGIRWTSPGPWAVEARIEANRFDGDPFFRSESRGPRGTWKRADALPAIAAAHLSGLFIAGNHVRNVSTPLVQSPGAANNLRGNIVHADPHALGFSVENAGVGEIAAAGPAWSYVIEASDPTAPDYGQVRSPTLASASAPPDHGSWVTGTFVAADPPHMAEGRLVTGWLRMTTGDGNRPGTDWLPVP